MSEVKSPRPLHRLFRVLRERHIAEAQEFWRDDEEMRDCAAGMWLAGASAQAILRLLNTVLIFYDLPLWTARDLIRWSTEDQWPSRAAERQAERREL